MDMEYERMDYNDNNYRSRLVKKKKKKKKGLSKQPRVDQEGIGRREKS
jgi:hypothetical protein